MTDALKQKRQEPDAGISSEFAGTMNLMAHPMAGAAAAGALGVGIASHVFGLWMGAIAGAAEASQRLMTAAFADDAIETPVAKPRRVKLRLVESTPLAQAAVVAVEAKHSRPKAIDKPATPDDLKAISGIGPKLEKVLNGFGIWTYAQIAALGEAEAAWLDEQFGFSGRIVRDDWTGQAALLGIAENGGSE